MGRLFGTDGVRGIANADLSCEIVYSIGRAAGTVLSDGNGKRPVFILGGDTRASTPMLKAAVSAGLSSVGADVIDVLTVPTPAVSYLIGALSADAGVMITASHNPYEYNGVKIFGSDGQKLPDMLEDEIESIVLGEKKVASYCGAEVGKIERREDAAKTYADHVRSLAGCRFDGLRVAIDASNGAATATAEYIFSSLGASVSMLSNAPNGVNVNDGCGSTHIEDLQMAVRSGNFDCGVAFDGDADRCIFVDERGELCDGDRIMAICALDLMQSGRLSKNTVVGTVMANLGFNEFCEKHGINFIQTKVGDRFVLEKMMLGGYNFGGEQSGHIIFSDLASTGDGQLTAAILLSVIKRSKKRLSELGAVMTPYVQLSENIRVNEDGKLRFYTEKAVELAIAEAKTALGNGGRVVVRPSGTEPLIRIMAEAKDEKSLRPILLRLVNSIREAVGE